MYKNLNKLLLGFIGFCITLPLIFSFVFVYLPKELKAAEEGASLKSGDYCNTFYNNKGKFIGVKMGVFVPGVTHVVTDPKTKEKFYAVRDLSCWIANFYKYFAGAIAIIAVVMMIYGGLKYVTSFGNPSRITSAKDTMTSAIVGLVLTLGTFVFLYTINPKIVTLSLPFITNVGTEQFYDVKIVNLCDYKEEGEKYPNGDLVECGDIKLIDPKNKDPVKAREACLGVSGCERGLFKTPFICQVLKDINNNFQSASCQREFIGIDKDSGEEHKVATSTLHECAYVTQDYPGSDDLVIGYRCSGKDSCVLVGENPLFDRNILGSGDVLNSFCF